MSEKRKTWHWLVLVTLSLIWGTSYILMKKGLESFSSFQVGALRILITFACLLTIALRNLCHLNRTNILSIIIIGLFGNVFPAFLFPLAETKISSSLAGMLNSISPVFTLVFGITIYKRKVIKTQIAGVILVLIGAAGLLYTGSFTFDTTPVFAATVTYFIPIVATLWGFADNEHFSSSMIISVVFIFAGVFIINRPDFFKKMEVISDE